MESTPSRLSFQVGQVVFEVEGESDLVRDGLAFVREYFPLEMVSAAATMEVGKAQPSGEPVVSAVESNDADVRPHIHNFYGSHPARSDMEKVTVLACYADQHLKMEDFTAEDLRRLFNEAGERKLPNSIETALHNAARSIYGYVERVKGKRGSYKITNAGRNLVNFTIPNRAKGN